MNVSFINSKKTCIVCHSPNFVRFYTNKREFHLINNEKIAFEQRLECCYNCGLVRQEDNPSYSDKNLDNYYQSTYRTPLSLENIDKNDKRKKNARQRIGFIKKLKPKGSLMEVGFGDGVFLNEAKRHFQCTGIDPSEGYSYIKDFLSKNGVTVYSKSLKSVATKNKYDVVCSFLVLEHIKNPIAFLSQIKRHLNPKGILVIEVPDIDRYKHFNTESMLTHEHVYHYNIKTLSFLLSQLDMELISYSNNNITYGFSLLAAFRAKKTKISKPQTNGFESLLVFEGFLDMRERYRTNMQKAIEKVINKAHDENQSIAVYGTGFLFNFAMQNCGLKTNELNYLFDDTKEKIGKKIEGKEILPLHQIAEKTADVVFVFSEMFFEPMEKNILNYTRGRKVKVINVHQQSL